jgi:hypothetical protein
MLQRFIPTRKQIGETVMIYGCFALCAAGLAGWIMNIAAVWNDGGFKGAIALRLIGIPFWPLGAILGWLS